MTAIEVECPVKGTWSFLNPPGHHPDAKDFVAVDENGKPYSSLRFIQHLFWNLKVVNVFAWGEKCFAPFDGLVVDVENSCTDRETLNLIRDVIVSLVLARGHKMNDRKFFLGNHVVLQSTTRLYALFAHLKKDSITVKEGSRVKAGELIAAIGNSGNTIQPHLHFQLMENNSPFTAVPLPFVFSSYERKEGNIWKKERSTLPKNGQVFRTRKPA